ncbi:MAG: hypothetical protein K0S32_632 [Bacteroidetes bacterium]|nr:hypothetical protein [Bacteroidota bacterium]
MLLKKHDDIKDLLDEAVIKYNQRNFIENDPISIPHQFTKKEDIEISGFLASTIAWGNRKSIITNANKLMALMDHAPHEFITSYSKKDLKRFENFVHRTFNGIDCTFFIESLRHIYLDKGGLEKAFYPDDISNPDLKDRIVHFRTVFLETKHLSRSEKHISNPAAKSSAKRLCMYLRWMVRKDSRKVDFGIWKNIPASDLCLPLDVHTGNVSRTLKLLKRTQNDWQAVEEITSVLRSFDPKDPVKYDFALFGLGVDGVLK